MKCESCNGSGQSSNPGQDCFFCNGSGKMCDCCGEALSVEEAEMGDICEICESEQEEDI